MEDVNKLIKSARRSTMNRLRKLFEPRMFNSGFNTGGRIGSPDRRALRVWVPVDKHKRPTELVLNGYVLTDFCGYSEEGVITDTYGGGCVTVPLSSFPLEDLLMLEKWAIKHFEKLDEEKAKEAELKAA